MSDVEPYSVARGNPAKFLKHRFDIKPIEILQDNKWWDWSVEKVTKNLKAIFGTDKAIFGTDIEAFRKAGEIAD